MVQPYFWGYSKEKTRPIKTNLIWKCVWWILYGLGLNCNTVMYVSNMYVFQLRWIDGRILVFIACFLCVCAFGIATVQRAPVMAAPFISCGAPSMPVLSVLRGTIKRLWALVSKEFRYMSIHIMTDHTVCEWDYFPALNVFILPFIRWLNVAKMCLCFSEDYLRVAATSEVHRWGVTASSEDQCLCDAGLLAEVWCLPWNCGCYIAHYHQLLLLEKDTQVRVHYLMWYLKMGPTTGLLTLYLLWHPVIKLLRWKTKQHTGEIT